MISRTQITLRFSLIAIGGIFLEATIWQSTQGTTRFVLSISLVLLIYLIIFFLSAKISDNSKKLNDILHQIAHKKYDNTLINPQLKPSILFDDLETIQTRLKKYNNRLSRNKEGFNIIIESLNEAIWIQNEKGILTDGNSRFKKLVKSQQIKGQYYWNIIQQKELYNLSEKALQAHSSFTYELKFNHRYYLCSASYSPLLEETIFILYDMTEIRKLELLKKDLVLNVSHELRTPLTSIKGYLETMAEDLPIEQLQYLKIILRNTDRLINIVQDLLTLSKLEHVKKIEPEKTRIGEFLQNIASLFHQILKKKNLHLNIEIDPDLSHFYADRFKLEQVFINLIDNAINFTDKGDITISAKKLNNSVEFRIKDTGSGIPQSSIPRLFERFYVVDKSRNRKMGGTGLGLSIVKHIINLHKGSILVQSEVGKGTEFIILIPRKEI